MGHDDIDVRQGGAVLQQMAIGHSFVLDAAGIGRHQKENREHGIDQQKIFDGVALFLATDVLFYSDASWGVG